MEQVSCWKEQPNRDQVLERAYDFVEALSNNDLKNAGKLVKLDDPEQLEELLKKHLKDFIFSWLEDDEADNLKDDLLANLYHPADLDEEWVNPEFEGKSFFLGNGEGFSLHLAFYQKPTNLQLHLQVCEEDALYYLKFMNISANPNLPAVEF